MTANSYCVFIWRIFVKAMRAVDEKQEITHKGTYIWQPVLISDASSLPSLLKSMHTATYSLPSSMSLASSLTTMEVAATKHYTDFSFARALHTPWKPLLFPSLGTIALQNRHSSTEWSFLDKLYYTYHTETALLQQVTQQGNHSFRKNYCCDNFQIGKVNL